MEPNDKLTLLEILQENGESLKVLHAAMGSAEDIEVQFQIALKYVQILTRSRRCRELLAELDREPEKVTEHHA